MPQKPESTILPFGKYKGKTLLDLLEIDPRYLDWLQDAEVLDKPQNWDLKVAIIEMNRRRSNAGPLNPHIAGLGKIIPMQAIHGINP